MTSSRQSLGEGKKSVRRGSATNLTLSGRSRARILWAKLMGFTVLSEGETSHVTFTLSEPDHAHRRFAGCYPRALIPPGSCRETSCIDPRTSPGIMGPERGGLQERGQIGRCSVSQGLHRIGGELLHSLGQRNRQ